MNNREREEKEITSTSFVSVAAVIEFFDHLVLLVLTQGFDIAFVFFEMFLQLVLV